MPTHAPTPPATICGRVASRSTALFDVGLYRLDASYRGPVHAHGRAAIALGVSGQMQVVGRRRTELVQVDAPLFIPADHAHRERVPFGTAVCVVAMPRDGELPGVAGRGLQPFRWNPLRRVGAQLMGELTDGDAVSDLAIDSVLLEVLASVARESNSGVQRRPARLSWLRRIEDRLREEFVDPPSAGELARDAGVSAAHLSRAFRAAHDTSIPRFVRALRVRRAALLLAQTQRPVADVAVAAGFYDQSHLNRCFREAMGVTPAAFRRAVSG